MKKDKEFFKEIFSAARTDFIRPSPTEETLPSDLYKYGISGAELYKSNFFSNYGNRNNNPRTVENDILALKEARNTDGYIGRALWNLQHKMVSDAFSFYVGNIKNEKANESKIQRMNDYFTGILNKSGHTTASFFDDLVHNIHYSNIYLHKKNDYVKNKTVALTLMPPVRWRVKKRLGYSVLAWEFIPEDRGAFANGVIEFDYKNIVHLTFNKEIDSFFGVPLFRTAIEDSALKRELENAAAGNFINATEQKPYVTVGDKEKGAPQEEIVSVINYLSGMKQEQIPVLSGRAEIKKTDITYVDGVPLINIFTDRMVASTGSSKTGLGVSSAGRQSAEADVSGEESQVDSYQQRLVVQLNKKLFMQLNYELFGDNIKEEDMVFIKANENFNKVERKEKHNVNLWVTGGVDQTEYEKRMGKKINFKTTFSSQKSDQESQQKLLGNQTNPSNQYGNRNSSKASKKN